MDGLEWKTLLKLMIWGTPIFGNTQMVVKDGDLLWSNPLKIAKIFVENLRVYPTPMPPHPRNEALFGDYYDYEPLLTRNIMTISGDPSYPPTRK